MSERMTWIWKNKKYISCSNILLNWKISLHEQKISSIIEDDLLYYWTEILSKVGNTKISPELIFDLVDEDVKISFDYLVFEKILEFHKEWLLKQNNIHINIQPFTLTDKNFEQRLESLFNYYNFKDFWNISFEILENWTIEDIGLLNKNIQYLRNKWTKVWLDDYPNSNNNNELLLSLDKLDFVKIDKRFSFSIKNNKKEVIRDIIQQLVTDIQKFHPGAKIIIEWVEDMFCYDFIKNNIFWIDYVQWYLFWKPNEI